MSRAATSPDDDRIEVLRRIDRVCKRFEDDWRAGRPSSLESLLQGWPEGHRAALLAELIPLEIELRRARGEDPRPADYLGRFPAEAGLILDSIATQGPRDPGSGAPTVAWVGVSTPPVPAVSRSIAEEPALPMAFGDYELLERLGRGGEGIVFRARQHSAGRFVALKMIPAGRFASDAERRRLRQEASLVANLYHENILPIYEVGEHDGCPYFSMRLIDGGSLARRVRELLDDPRGAARLLRSVARAIHYAHSQGFIHCDLKPANILLDRDGRPYVTDFGLARQLLDDPTDSTACAVRGTAGYMAPEQASGAPEALNPLVDVYGLGATLYELLTGRPPFQAATVMETVVMAMEREPARPRDVRPRVPAALERICLRCLEKSPENRYASAAELADHLEQYLRGEAIAGPTPWHLLRRWVRREPELAAHLVGLAVITAVNVFNYLTNEYSKPPLFFWVQGVLTGWAVASLFYQWLLNRGSMRRAIPYAWAMTDVAALTSALGLIESGWSSRVLGYPLLIAASGLWCQVPLVWFTTAASVLGYLSLRLVPSETQAFSPNIDVAALLITGFIVAQQVKRIWALSLYYENRPAA